MMTIDWVADTERRAGGSARPGWRYRQVAPQYHTVRRTFGRLSDAEVAAIVRGPFLAHIGDADAVGRRRISFRAIGTDVDEAGAIVDDWLVELGTMPTPTPVASSTVPASTGPAATG